MKKIISALIIISLLASIICVPGFAFSEEDFPIPEGGILASADFSSLAVGGALRSSAARGKFSITDSDEKGPYIGTKDPFDSSNICVSNTNTETTGPRIAYTVDTKLIKKFTYECRAFAKKLNGEAVAASIIFYDNATQVNKSMASTSKNTWTYIKLVCDVYAGKVYVYMKDSKNDSYSLSKTISYTFPESVSIRASSYTGKDTVSYFDDLSVYTDDRTPNSSSAIFFTDDFGTYSVNQSVLSSKLWSGADASSFTAVSGLSIGAKDNVGKLMVSSKLSARAYSEIYVGGYTHFTVSARVNAKEVSKGYLMLSDGNGNVAARIDVSGDSDWHTLRIDIDEESGYIKTFKDGVRLSFEPSEFEKGETYMIETGATGTSGKSLYIDDVCAFDDDRAFSGGSVDLSKMVYRPTGVVPIGDILRNSHPRVIVTDFAELYNKIKADAIASKYYELNFDSAESLYNVPPTEFEIYQRPGSYYTTLTTARTLEGRMFTLACVYNIEKERIKAGECTYAYVKSRGYNAAKYGSEDAAVDEFKNHVEGYKARALEEIYNAGTYPTWLPETMICMSETAEGVAIGYDWLYNYTTEQQHKDIIDILDKFAAVPYVLSYAGKKYGGWTEEQNNRTVVNASASMSVASALYDYYPGAAEYIMQGAVSAIEYGMMPYQYDGAFPEGPGYWSYSTEFFCIGQSTILSMIGAGETVPQYAKFYENFAGLDTACDYYILYNGPLGSFNYCDCDFKYGANPTLYYFATLYNKPEYAAYNRGLENKSSPTGIYSVCAISWMDTNDINIYDIEKLPLDKVYDNPKTSSVVFNGASFRSSFDMTDASWAAIRGGANNASHGYPAGGEFVFEANGVRWARLQDRHNYDDKEYYYNRRGEGHNTVIVNPSENNYTQENNAYVHVLSHKETKNSAWAILDMTQTNANLSDAKRGILLTNDRKSMLVRDEFTAKSPSEFYWFMHTHASFDDIVIAPDGQSALISIAGERLYVHLNDVDNKGLKLDKMASIPLAPEDKWLKGEREVVYSNLDSPNPTPKFGYKLFVHAENASSFKLSVELVPLGKDGGTPSGKVLADASLSDWSDSDFDALAPKKSTSYDNMDTEFYSPSQSQFVITTPEELAGLSYLVNEMNISFEGKAVTLGDNIDLSETEGEWVPIGTPQSPFKGKFDGNGKSVSNFGARTEKNFFGLFGACDGAYIKNLTLDKLAVDGGYVCGALVGSAINSDIENVSAQGSVIGTYYVGAIAGYAENSRIINCLGEVDFPAKPIASYRAQGSGFVGGIVGFANQTKIANCLTNGEMPNLNSQSQIAGRIAGMTTYSELENVFYPDSSTINRALYNRSSYSDMGIYRYNTSSGKIILPEGMKTTAGEMLGNYAADNGYSQWTGESVPHILMPSPDTKNLSRFLLSEESVSGNTVSVDVKNVSSLTSSSYIVAASYKNGTMKDFKMKYVTLLPNETQKVVSDINTSGCDKVLIFSWSTLSGMYTNGNMITVEL